MGQKLHNRIELWKKQLLDFGKRNRLINFREGQRSSIKITSPSFDMLWKLVAVNEQEIVFPYAKKVRFDDEGEEKYDTIIKGDVETDKSIGDLQKTLKALRYKSNTSIDEQGINTLYLTFGMLKWKERDDSSQVFSAPVILVPVKLFIESLISPYRLTLHDDEIVINPTLSHKLDNDFGITMPEFDSTHDSPTEYIDKLLHKIENKGWYVEKSIHLTNLSFLKINMYKDLDRNEEKINSNPVIAALVGEQEPIQVSGELNNFDHDKQIRPLDTFQVVDADSSQQDAILLSKKGVSFVLQGPPGTGKSQTITNIIAEAIADGKKVLFVSEKMTALQIVYNRLASVGLADFCFTLHSHKAKKKEILRALANSINIDHTRVRDEALAQLDLLERKRDFLNEYQKELHTPTSGLNMSIFSVNGKLAKLENVPDVVFSIPETDSITTADLNERVYLLNELSKTIEKRSEDYVDNVWRDSSIKVLTNALRHEIDSNVNSAIPIMKEMTEQHSYICTKFNIKLEPSLTGIDELISVLSFLSKTPFIPLEWITSHDIESLIDNARQYKKNIEQLISAKNELRDKFVEQVFNIDATKYKDRLSNLAFQLQVLLKDNTHNFTFQIINQINNETKLINDSINSLFEEARIVASKLCIPIPDTFEEFALFAETTKTLEEIHKTHPTLKWFNNDELLRIKSDIKTHELSHKTVIESKRVILNCFDKEILNWDFYPVLQRYRGEHKSLFRSFSRQYHKDRKQLDAFLSNGGSLSYNDALETLKTLKTLSDNQEFISNNSQYYRENYGNLYADLDTQWDILYNKINTFEHYISHTQTIPSHLREAITNEQLPIADIIHFNTQHSKYDIVSAFEQLSSILKCDFDKKTNWKDIKVFVEQVETLTTDLISKSNDLISLRNTSCDFGTLISDLNLLVSFNVLQKELTIQKDTIQDLYKEYYHGIETDWDLLFESLNYSIELSNLIAKYDFPLPFVEEICGNNNQIKSFCNEKALLISGQREKLQKYIAWFASLFKNGKDFYQCNILDLANRMSLCKDKKHLLEEWVDYCSTREKCGKAGLGEYVNKVVDFGVKSDYIVDAYLKRFYHLWLDAILPNFPAVQNFRGRIQEQTIKEFCELDKGQFKIAQARVRERALSRIPDFNTISDARDEIAILKRELNKQRRLMPLRKLFMAIPNLITSLRPCFMMSPLSVSVFLEAQSYNFDMVIFDEASQVHTEDAVGAIMRGKQTIIVGDTKQLPPTNFFLTSLNDEDFDIDSAESIEDYNAGAYESILDEAVAVLPERSLRWHYRSRHEHLIAFSNIKIYNNQLITFPSSVEDAPDCGVEYVYVKDGVYDRGGKKNNIAEARKVAELVFEHIKKHPERSLGVVTFSEAQQNAVDAVIRQKRIENPHFESFFIEDKEEPFFIKNLENVQGDERDTIIFSIGYAKDNKGIMYMNFGPLSREGGYRRLNVAITRAKHNIKLIGSIMPTDIYLDKVSSEGVKMLRSYIEFAQQGIVALEKELTFNYDLNFDSPFEEAVYDFLQSKGYNVITQVGCSGFRIDMAVKHPSQNGKFAIGIECDGATYHNSRTARERDRLRQAILEDMGWTIYRIWSTDWIKDPKTEEEKLVNAIEQAIGNIIVENVVADENNDNANNGISTIEIEEKVETSQNNNTGYGFELYERAYPPKDIDENGNPREKYDIVWDIISLEQPIHFEELCRRIAPAFGRQKATSVVRDEVRNVFRNQLNGKILEDTDGFIRIINFTDVKVRIPNPNDNYLRPISYICEEELALAMKTIAQHSFGITPDDLFIVTAREFGFKRTGENIIHSLRKVYQCMLQKKEIIEVDGKVCIER